jgi:hypothetical protein
MPDGRQPRSQAGDDPPDRPSANRGDGAEPVEQDRHPQTIPRWAWAVAAIFVGLSLLVLAIGRGGAAVLSGVALAFAALAVLLLSVPDRDPGDE